MDGSQPINPYLAGNYAPVASEHDFDLVVAGEMPAGLTGAFYRNGPNPQFAPRRRVPLVRRRRHDPRRLHRGRQKLRYRNRFTCAPPKWRLENEAGRWPCSAASTSAQRRPVGRRYGRRRRQHQHRLARRPPDGPRGGPSALRTRSAHTRISRLPGRLPRPGYRPPQARSRDRRDGMVRLRRRGGRRLGGMSLRRDPALRARWCAAKTSRPPTAAWSTTSW